MFMLSNMSLRKINIRFHMASTLSLVLANEFLLSDSIWFHQYLGGKNPPAVRSIAVCLHISVRNIAK